jgi:protein-tyrosine phosphatase
VIVALALRAVGVRRDEVVADYARTAERIAAVMGRLGASPTYGSRVNRVTLAEHTPRAAAMDRFLTELDRRYGGAVPWLESHGFTPDELDRLKAKLLS